MEQLQPRIYVACLAAYNNGHLHGRWIDANQDEDGIREEIRAMLAESPIPNAEEWAIHDYEGFAGIELSEYEGTPEVAKLAQLLAEHGEAYAAYAGHVGLHYATEEGFQDAYCGQWDSEEDYAESLTNEGMLGEIPENLRPYIDVEKWARDLFISDYCSVDAEGGGVFVFPNC